MFMIDLETLLPLSAVRLVEDQVRQVHTERPDLDMRDALEIVCAVLEGNQQDTSRILAAARAEHAKVVATAKRSRDEIDALARIQTAYPELERLEARFPGRSTAAKMLADAGRTWGDFGLTEADGALFQELLDEHAAG
ncbi:hypothetical protein AMK27_38160 [Streptomyces sp. CB02009]|uniref:hypothetical protein n=1 Tax=Streptomyces sp. CB02009 TaxID=1703938 RepID=UPI000939CB27|nr:hypothetical protein [Streptomyces sp. CB02009]OKJ48605.1 hypothetical protein AMK27_38160 [Streptomyces sp. CB02009]